MTHFKRTLVTAALPYANGPIHIGHIAGCYLPSDIYVRLLKLQNKEVLFICGSDEHGVPITISAKREGLSPQQIVDKYHASMQESFKGLDICFDYYGRTSSPIHHETAQTFFKNLYDKDQFKTIATQQFFDTEAQQFLADRYIVGTCPRCCNEKAYGDQCEKCGSSLSPDELINPQSALSQSIPIKKETTNWFLPLDELQPKIAAYIQEHSQWKSNVWGQCKSWLDSGNGLQARAMTRDLDWGVKVPLSNANGKVLYVWFDAPIGYISATKEWAAQNNTQWETWWKQTDTELIHFIGKDNIVFHCIIFPAMLMQEGSFILPNQVPANEFLNLEGDKISTSRQWAVWVHEYINEFPNQSDVLRYVLCSIAPETKDSEFTWKDFQTRNNSELVSIFGNFVNRVLVLVHKYFQGKVPEAQPCSDLQQYIQDQAKNIENNILAFKFRDALHELMQVARYGNKLLAEKEPWKLYKTDPNATAIVLYDTLQICANLALLCHPFMPQTSKKLCALLQIALPDWSQVGSQLLVPVGHQINDPEHLFSNIEDEIITKQIQKLQIASNTNTINAQNMKQELNETQNELKPCIGIEDFSKCEIKVGTILEVESVPKADKLLKLKIDIGNEHRTILSGIAKHYKPEQIVGKQVSVLVNLEPRTMRGIESQGMILMAEDTQGNLIFVQPETFTTPGSTIR